MCFWRPSCLFLELSRAKETPLPLSCRRQLNFVDRLEKIQTNLFHDPLFLNILASTLVTSPKPKPALKGTKDMLNLVAQFRYDPVAKFFKLAQR